VISGFVSMDGCLDAATRMCDYAHAPSIIHLRWFRDGLWCFVSGTGSDRNDGMPVTGKNLAVV
jgi:hypothetical protein